MWKKLSISTLTILIIAELRCEIISKISKKNTLNKSLCSVKCFNLDSLALICICHLKS